MALQNKRTYRDLGLNDFLTSPLSSSARFTSVELAEAIPTGALSSGSQKTTALFTTSIAFSATDNDTAAWAEGTINFATGKTTETIVAGNTGNITATTYIYYDEGKKGALQTTTRPTEAARERRYLLAIVEKVTDATKKCKITTVNATGLVVSELVASNISGNQLDVLAANTGTLTVDEYIDVGSSRIRIDGGNVRITLNDGTTNRGVWGDV